MNKSCNVVVGIFLIIIFNSIIYGAINSEMFIDGEVHVRVNGNIRITDFKLLDQVDGAYEVYNSDYSKDTTSMQVVLPNSGSAMTYEVVVTNSSSKDYVFYDLIEQTYSNHNIKYEIIDLEKNDIVNANSTCIFKIRLTGLVDDLSNQGIFTLQYKFGIEEMVDGPVIDINYSGDVYEFIASDTGVYKLEVWGAQGGGHHGNGGYSVGIKRLRQGEKLYVYVGERGKNRATGAFNGGGVCYCYIHSDRKECNGGGGATDIRTTKNDNYNDRLIVAGGGGGNYAADNFGYGGGEVSGSTYAYLGVKETYPANGAVGGNCKVIDGSCAGGSTGCSSSYQYISLFTGAGGGGYVGGVGVFSNTSGPSGLWASHIIGSAAGGTGYIGGVENGTVYGVEKKTIAGNMEVPTYDGTSTMKGNTGDGYAKITLIAKVKEE